MKSFFCLPLSRLAQASAAALIALVLAGAARADTIKVFDVSGTGRTRGAVPVCAHEICPFSGTLTIDVTSSPGFPHGRVMALDITVGPMPPFNVLEHSAGFSHNGWEITATNHTPFCLSNPSRCSLVLQWTTSPHPRSLVNFAHGTIVGEIAFQGPPGGTVHLDILSGSITPAAVPEPSSLVLLGPGLIGLVGMALGRKPKLAR